MTEDFQGAPREVISAFVDRAWEFRYEALILRETPRLWAAVDRSKRDACGWAMDDCCDECDCGYAGFLRAIVPADAKVKAFSQPSFAYTPKPHYE